MLTKQEIAQALPANLKTAATQQLADLVNNIVADPLIAEQVQQNFISYAHVLKEGKYKSEDYVHAVAYVSFKHMGYSNQDAYFKTFPSRHQALVAKGTSSKDISSYVAAYHKGKLVNAILEQSLIPVWLLNQENYQKAINTQVDLMQNAQSEMVRTTAANSILTHLAKPKEVAGKISIDINESSGMNEMREALASMAKRQQELIELGVNTREIAGQRIIQGEVV
jgi:hypothetical protein